MSNLLATKNRRVLVIDDNRAIHDDFRKILCPATTTSAALKVTEAALFGVPLAETPETQFEVDSAYQGQEGVALVEKKLAEGLPYAMAFVDVRMPPGWDGVETTRKIWELDPNLQIVLCTAYSDYSWDEMFEKLGRRDGLLILKKPFDGVEAFQLAHALTEKWGLHQESQRKMEEMESAVAERTRELQLKTAFLEAQVNSSLDGILVVDQEGKMSLQNQRFTELLKIPQHIAEEKNDENRLRWVTDMTKDPKLFVEKVTHLYANPSEISRDELELKDGTILDRYSSPAMGKDGKYYGRIWTFRDITERKQMENALRESNEKFNQLADNITDSFWIRSPDLREVYYVSPAFERIWGRSVESLYANPEQWADFILPEDRERALAGLTALTGEAASMEIEYRIVRPDGEIRWVRVRGFQVLDEADKLVSLTGTVTDITDRKQASVSLLESQQRLDLARQSAHIGIWDWDVVANKLVWDAQMYELYGIREEDFGGAYDAWQQGLHPEDRKSGDDSIHAALDGSKDFHIEFRVVWPDGEVRHIEARAIVQRASDGTATRMIGVNWDITERKRLEGQLFQSQKMETVGKLAGGIAHEFNSILTAIIGQSELLIGDLPPGSPLVKNASEISQAAGRAAKLTRQLLAYGRKQFLQPETLDLNQVLTGMEGMFHHIMGGEVDIQIIPASDLRAVKADAGQIEQVLINMVINGRDAMAHGGKLTLETANVSFEEESVGRYPELKPGNYVMLAITDTGTGMSPEVRARIFEPFFSTKDVGQGTGLGLSTCYGIIKQSGGHISVYSELARGASFKIYLPQVEQELKVAVPRFDSTDLPGGTETILLVEDDPALLEMAATLLRRLGYTVLAAGNGIEALSLKHQRDTGHIDLLFTDVVMPHMSGKELADRVRSLYPYTKILFTSAYTENAIVHQGVLDKGVTLLQKPFTPAALARKIRDVLDRRDVPAPSTAPSVPASLPVLT